MGFDNIKVIDDNNEAIIKGFCKNTKLSNGQTAMIIFEEISNTSKKLEYSIIFAIANKKKYIIKWLNEESNVLDGNETGHCGVEGLIWAKKQMLYFEGFIKEQQRYNDKNITIVVWWTDKKRRNVYEKALGKIGYEISFRYNSKCLIKKIKERG